MMLPALWTDVTGGFCASRKERLAQNTPVTSILERRFPYVDEFINAWLSVNPKQ
jgi:hypothetical protein